MAANDDGGSWGEVLSRTLIMLISIYAFIWLYQEMRERAEGAREPVSIEDRADPFLEWLAINHQRFKVESEARKAYAAEIREREARERRAREEEAYGELVARALGVRRDAR